MILLRGLRYVVLPDHHLDGGTIKTKGGFVESHFLYSLKQGMSCSISIENIESVPLGIPGSRTIARSPRPSPHGTLRFRHS